MSMKKILSVIVMLAVSVTLFAQESNPGEKKSPGDKEMNTIFGHKDHPVRINLGYFLELNGAYTQFDGRNAFLPGGSMGIILNHHWTVGMSGSMVMPHNLFFDDIYYDETLKSWQGANLGGGFGGGLFEYTLLPKSVVHVAFPLIIGGGYMAYYTKDNANDGNDWNHHWNYHTVASDYFFYIEPGVRAEFNVVKMLRLGIGVSYRYCPGFSLPNTSENMLNQFNAKLTLRIGKF
jgi:hypothetical protein